MSDRRAFGVGVAAAVIMAAGLGFSQATQATQGADLGTPGFHHLHLNAVSAATAVDFYAKHFATNARAAYGGAAAVKAANNVWLLFNQVKAPPSSASQSAYWHVGWHVRDSRGSFERYKQERVTILPLFTSDQGESVRFSSDAPLWPGNRTRPQIEEERNRTPPPTPRWGAGYLYVEGPDGVAIEVLGDMPAERFNHVHMYQDDPFCAERWYQQHLNAALTAGRRDGQPAGNAPCQVALGQPTWLSLERRGTVRAPAAGVIFDDVEMNWYQWPGPGRLVTSEGQTIDHVGLSVANLAAWLTKMQGEGVRILAQPYRLGDTRAFMIEGPSRERIELVEKR